MDSLVRAEEGPASANLSPFGFVCSKQSFPSQKNTHVSTRPIAVMSVLFSEVTWSLHSSPPKETEVKLTPPTNTSDTASHMVLTIGELYIKLFLINFYRNN